MTYIKLHSQLQKEPIPKNLLIFIKDQLDMQFNDVHCMLRLPIDNIGLTAGCNFAIANTLLSLVSGLAAMTCQNLSTRGSSAPKFKEVTKKYFPWPGNILDEEKEKRAGHLYDFFRNPLAHSFGVRTEGNFWVHISRINGMDERRLEELESEQSLYEDLIYEPQSVNGEDIQKVTLVVDHLYANVRKMLKIMVLNPDLAKQISNNLVGVGIK